MDYGNFKSGDIGLSTSSHFMSKVIRFFTSWHTSSASKSHVFAFVDKDLIVEALARVSINSPEKYADTEIAIYRLPLSDQDRESFRINMLRQGRRAYGWLKLPLFALDAIATKATSLFGNKKPVFFFTKYLGISNIPVCSQLVIWGLHKFTDYRLKDQAGRVVNWKVVSPDYFEDLLKLEKNQAELIYQQEAC